MNDLRCMLLSPEFRPLSTNREVHWGSLSSALPLIDERSEASGRSLEGYQISLRSDLEPRKSTYSCRASAVLTKPSYWCGQTWPQYEPQVLKFQWLATLLLDLVLPDVGWIQHRALPRRDTGCFQANTSL